MAARYWVGGHPTNNNWNQTGSGTTNWSATSGGAAGASVPGSTDDVTFDVNGNSTSTLSAIITIQSLTITSGYTSTITHNATLTVTGNVTLGANYTIAGTGALTISSTSTMTSNGKTWPNNMTLSTSTTKTLADSWSVTGSLTVTGGNITLNKTASETLTVAGGITSITTAVILGTAKIILTGGTWSWGTGSNGISNDLDIQGNVTVSGTVRKSTGVLTYVSGTVTTTSSTLSLVGSQTLNTNGITWGTISVTSGAAITLTINSTLTASTFTSVVNQDIIFAGSAGFNFGTFGLSENTSATTITFQESVTYTITTALNIYYSRVGAILLLTSSSGTVKAIITLVNGATCNCLANLTRIDASGGRTINSFNGTVTDCTNVRSFSDLVTVASAI
jgi:hypothetical protein